MIESHAANNNNYKNENLSLTHTSIHTDWLSRSQWLHSCAPSDADGAVDVNVNVNATKLSLAARQTGAYSNCKQIAWLKSIFILFIFYIFAVVAFFSLLHLLA